MSYSLEQFVKDVKHIMAESNDEHELLSEVRPIARQAARDRSWLKKEHYVADEKQGFGSNPLHVEKDKSLFIVAVSWLPGRGAPPHNHGTWAIVAGVDGPERNVFWERLDDGLREGYAELRKTGDIDEVKTVPDVQVSHPFVEQLIGAIRGEFLDHVLFWNTLDLERKLGDFQHYYNHERVHASLGGATPAEVAGKSTITTRAKINDFRWQTHCRGLIQLPLAA
jgi:predicted metal-dependent enzyme (double-stranded beta helix superfamily)